MNIPQKSTSVKRNDANENQYVPKYGSKDIHILSDIYDWPWLRYLGNEICCCWIMNTTEICLTDIHVSRFEDIYISVLGPQCAYRCFLEIPHMRFLLRRMVFINCRDFSRNRRCDFRESRHFVFWGPSDGPLFWSCYVQIYRVRT
jgi:hypothetical protein